MTARVMDHGTVARYTAGCRCEPCRKAKSDYTQRWRRDRGIVDHSAPFIPRLSERVLEGRFDLAPLIRELERRGLFMYDFLSDFCSGVSIKDWRANGIPWQRLDTVCCRLGLHPGDLYGYDAWDKATCLEVVDDPALDAWCDDWAAG